MKIRRCDSVEKGKREPVEDIPRGVSVTDDAVIVGGIPMGRAAD